MFVLDFMLRSTSKSIFQDRLFSNYINKVFFRFSFYNLLTLVVFSRDFPCSDYTRPLFKMTAQFFFIQEIASNDVLSNTYIPFFHEKSLKGENSIFLEKLFQYRKVSSIFEKSVTHFIG